MKRIVVVVSCVVILFSVSASCYNVGDHVPFFVNKVGPLNNPSETYQYYDLPFCRPASVFQMTETIGEVLNGDRLMSTRYELNFREGHTHKTLCEKTLEVSEIAIFRNAVINDFYFQMYYDDLPLWGFVGKVEESWSDDDKGPRYYLFKHVQFDALYNGNQVIEIKAFSDPNHVVDITEDVERTFEFTYSVNWTSTSVLFENRMDKYIKASLLPMRQRIHWFSFVNSVVIIVFLMGFLALLIMRRLNNDLRRCSNIDEEEDKDVGWKYLHGDVFRCPSNISVLCAVLGTGTQLLVLICVLFLFALFGFIYPYNRGALLTCLVLGYALTSLVAGYTASYFHNQFSETGWERSVLLAGILYAGPLLVTTSIANMVAFAKGATAALPFGTIVAIFLIYILLVVPLLFLGGSIGRNFRCEYSPPYAVKPHPREIPALAWYRKALSQMLVGGLLPFSAIVFQLHHLFATIWGYKIHTLPGILFVAFVILFILTAILSVILTYLQLSVEDHRWWWRSVLCGGSTAIFMFGYGVYFYFKSSMNGLMQFLFFMGYNACILYGFFLVLGTVSFCASLIFVRYIYRAVKSE